MAVKYRISSFLNKQTYIIPLLFALMCLCLISSLVGVELKGLANIANHGNTFNIGGEICAIFAAVMITISILPTYKRQSGYIRLFVTLIASLCFTMTSDLMQAIVDGMPDLIWLNKTFVVLVWVNETATFFFFWLFLTNVLRNEGQVFNVLKFIALGVLIAFILIPVVTVGNPLYFTIDAAGVYARRQPEFWISRIPSTFFIVATVISLILSKAPMKKKIVMSVFMGLPILAMGSGGYKTGVAIQYCAMMMSITLIFALIFSDREKDLYSTTKELGIATNIQKHMLPSIFPAFPDRKEFDIYARMTPAKQVGGDFYDFFLVDDDHLAIVMADVSDKGVPAALFMMACKIMVQNYTMMGKSPAEVLNAVNNQICQNNQDEMFVTIWMGILDLKTGKIVCANAGHEKPLFTNKKGEFELYKDTNNFVVGWYKNIKYKEYELQIEKGSKIFLYTDGVPESTGEEGQFTREGMVKNINKYAKNSPTEIVNYMQEDIEKFVGDHDQFDDITMLCVEYKG